MVFPRNVGFGRCYLVSTRHEIISNIDRNAKPNRNSAAAPKKPKWNKSRESTDPIPVFLLSLESQTVTFRPFDFHLRKFKKFTREKFYFHNHAPTLACKQALCLGKKIARKGKGRGERACRQTIEAAIPPSCNYPADHLSVRSLSVNQFRARE